VRWECEKLNKNVGKETSEVAFSIGALETIDRRGTKRIATREPNLKRKPYPPSASGSASSRGRGEKLERGRRTERGVILAERSRKGKMGRSTKVKIPTHRKKR
jgi:hypothetical protein